MGLSTKKTAWVWLNQVYRARRWVYLIAASHEHPGTSRQGMHALWQVDGTTSIEQAKAAVLYYQVFNFGSGASELNDWPDITVKSIL